MKIDTSAEEDIIAKEECPGDFEPWVVALSVSLTLSIIGFILRFLMENNALELTNFKDRAIGIAVISGVDTALRTKLYVEFILGAIILFCVFFILFQYTSKKHLRFLPIAFEKQMIFYVSLFAIASIVLYVTSRQILFLNNLMLLYFLLILVSFFIIIEAISYRLNLKGVSKMISNNTIIILSLIFPFVAYIIGLVLFNKSLSFANDIYHYLLLSFLWFLFLAAYYLLNLVCKRIMDPNFALSNLITLSFLPILLIPISIPLSNELQFTLSGVVHVSPRSLSTLIAFFLLLSSLILSIILSKKPNFALRSLDVLEYVYFPIIVASVVLFRYYQHSLEISAYDMFHHGELLISNQQLFSFGSLPYIGIYPTHGLSEMYYQVLYSVVNGYRPVEPLLWGWITPIIGALLVYFVLKNIADPVFSLFTILFIPISDNMGGYYYTLSMLMALCLIWAYRRMTFFRSAVLWIMLVFLFLWRLDFGLAATAGVIFILAIIHIKNLYLNKFNLAEVRNLSLSLIMVAILSFITFTSIIIVNTESISEILLQNIQFAAYQNLVASYVDIITSYSNLAVLQYAILPCISLIYIIYFLVKFLIKNGTPPENQILLVFLAIFSLILSVRSVQRHSLIEGYVPYLFIFLLICLPFYLRLTKNLSRILFLGIFLAYLLAFPSYTIMLNNQNGDFFEYHDWQDKESRVFDNKAQYQDIVSFINGYLGQNQTFFDFTNSPIIYVFTNKKHIPYIIPNLYQTSESIQTITLDKLEDYHDKGNLPLVIFKQNNYWDYVDSVPNEIRSYKIVEFIYTFYRPLGLIDNYQIWVEKNSSLHEALSQNEARRRINFKPQELFLYDVNKISADELAFRCGGYDPQISNFLDLASAGSLNMIRYPLLKIRYKSSIAGDLQIFYGYNGSPFEELYSRRVNLKNTSQNYSEVLVPISSGKIGLTDIRFDPPSNSVFEIESVEVSERKTALYPISSKDIHQDFDLKKLPYIWGKYDGKDASTNTEILEEVNISQARLDKDQEVIFSFNPIIDKSSGNYIHFKIKSTSSGNFVIKYGNESISSITFQVVPSAEYEDYLVRISSQWLWMGEPISRITIRSSEAVEVGEILIRKGD